MSSRHVGQDRLDRVLVARGLAPTRAKAQGLVMAGRVRSRGVTLHKAGLRVPSDIQLELLPGRRYVSRAAPKLDAALERFAVRTAGRDALDVGASTGGFTQILLERGALRVVALDVGRGQLDWSLRSDARVIPLEGINARYLTPAMLPFPPSLAVIDVSFISLELVLPPVAACVEAAGEVVALVKPQFEVGRAQVGRGGVVREAELHRRVLERLIDFSHRRGLRVLGVCASPVRGAEGNQEYFLHVRPGLAAGKPDLRGEVSEALAQAREARE